MTYLKIIIIYIIRKQRSNLGILYDKKYIIEVVVNPVDKNLIDNLRLYRQLK